MRVAAASFALVAVAAIAFAAPAKPVPSSRLKAYKGPEGEVVALVEANNSKQMLVYFKNVDGLDGKTLLYDYEDLGEHGKNVFVDKKRGSKTYRSTMLVQRDGGWEFYHPDKSSVHFYLTYSDEASGKIKVDDVLAAYKP
jgi:hypothetical protein